MWSFLAGCLHLVILSAKFSHVIALHHVILILQYIWETGIVGVTGIVSA